MFSLMASYRDVVTFSNTPAFLSDSNDGGAEVAWNFFVNGTGETRIGGSLDSTFRWFFPGDGSFTNNYESAVDYAGGTNFTSWLPVTGTFGVNVSLSPLSGQVNSSATLAVRRIGTTNPPITVSLSYFLDSGA